MMGQSKKSAAWGALALFALASCLPITVQAADDGERFRDIYEREWDFRLREFPLFASYVGVHDYDDALGRVSEADQVRRHAFWKSIAAELDEISCERLSHEDCIDYRIFVKQIDNFIAEYETHAYLLTFNSDGGFFMEWGRLPEETRFRDVGDYRNYLARLHDLPRAMDEYIALMRRGLEIGMTQPRVILSGRDEPIKAQLVGRAEESPFYQPFVELPETVAGGDRAELLATAGKVISEDVIPAYRRLFEFFHREYLPGARETLGASELPDGERFYRAQIRLYATVEMTPREIHDLGLEQVARIRGEMQNIIEQVGFDGDFAAFLAFLRSDPRFYAKTPKELLAHASYYAKKIDGRLPMLFGRLPRQPYGVAPVPEEIAPFYTAGRYVPAPADAPRGGYYWVNTHALPGRPPFRRYDYISAFGEGWALYAEKLGLEMDIYETPYEHFGRLTYEMWRACRLVIDTGVHAFGWSRQQALDYLSSNTALSMHEVTTEVDRYISWPAQALSYKLGEYTILRLRRQAEQELGAEFDIRAFHDFLLSLGSVPLDLLSDEMTRWVSQQQ